MKSMLGPSCEELLAKLPPARRARVLAEGERLLAEAMTLRELRRAHKLTQAKLARKLRTSQNQISRIEKHSDLLLSTLRGMSKAWAARSTSSRSSRTVRR